MDRRGQSVVIGTVILFGFFIIAISGYQAGVVPQNEREEEFRFIDQTTDSLVMASSKIRTTGTTGFETSQTFNTYEAYDSFAFVHPPGMRSSVDTTNPRQVKFVNLSQSGIFRKNQTYKTQQIRVRYGLARSSIEASYYENGYVYSKWPGGEVIESGAAPVTGKTITLTLFRGNVSSRGAKTDLSFVPISVAEKQTINTTNTSSIVLPTSASNRTWSRLLSDANISGYTYQGDSVRINLKNQTKYTLLIAVVGLEEDSVEAKYITLESVNGTSPVIVKTRDKYGNPISAEIEWYSNTTKTGPDGLARLPITNTTNVSLANGNDEVTVKGGVSGSGLSESEVRSLINSTSLNRSETLALINASSLNESEAQELINKTSLNKSEADKRYALKGESSGGDAGAGSGSITNYQNDSDISVATSGGIWENITNAQGLSIKSPRLVPIQKIEGDLKQSKRYFKLVFTIYENVEDNDDVKYFIQIGSGKGIKYKPSDGSIGNAKVYIYKQNADGSVEKLIDGKELRAREVRGFIEDGDPLDILQGSSYSGGGSDSGLNEVRRKLNDDNKDEIFITAIRGRVELALDTR